VRCIQLLEGSKLITGSDDRTVKIWDLLKIDENNRREPYEHSITSAHPEDAAAEEEERKKTEEQEADKEDDLEAAPVAVNSSVDDLHRMDYCLSMTIEGHRGEVTALYAEDGSLVSVDAEACYCALTLSPSGHWLL
jgi:WD40 repeat protein